MSFIARFYSSRRAVRSVSLIFRISLGGVAFMVASVFSVVSAQRIATLQVTTKGTEKFSIPVHTSLDAITFLHDSVLLLNEITAGKKTAVPFQIEAANGRVLHWLVLPSKNKQRVFELVKTNAKNNNTAKMSAAFDNGKLVLSNGRSNLLQYNYKTVYPPKGVDTAYKRSGFIHPLNTPNGQPLSRINAPDHYHHYGLWNPWTRVLFEKDTVDFWNVRDRKGTVRFGGFGAVYSGNVFSGFTALHEHIAFKNNNEKIAINELQTVKTYNPGGNSNYYLMDIDVHLSPATNSEVRLLEYRYAGIGIRATELWNKENSTTLTSEGKDRKGADGSTARWCLTQGQLGSDYGGLVMMSYPANYNHPEPLRVWPENSNGRGDVFLNFSPTKNTDWLLEPGKTYVLKYRFLVFNNKVTGAEAEEAWQNFAKPPVVRVLNVQK